MASDAFVRCCLVVFLFSVAGLLNRVSGNLESTTAQPSEKCRIENNDTLYCDTKSSGPDWIVIQQRFDNWVNFPDSWKDYRDGFGEVGQGKEFWMGLERIHQLTKSGQYELLVELTDFHGEFRYARYSEFVVEGESSNYKLAKMGCYGGTARDINNLLSDKIMEGQLFSTRDRDNDRWTDFNCAEFYGGGWWYNRCGVGLTSRFHLINRWLPWKQENLKSSRMLIRYSTPDDKAKFCEDNKLPDYSYEDF